MIRPYNGITRNGSTIISVEADNFENAEWSIVEELSEPGRTDVLASWTAQGRLIELQYEDNSDPAAIDLCNQIMRHLRAADW